MLDVSGAESELLFFSTFHYAPIGMCLLNPDGQWVKVNPAFCKLVGYTDEEIIGMTAIDIMHPEDVVNHTKYFDQLLCGEVDTFQVENRYIHKLGRIVWTILSVSVVPDTEGNPKFIIAQIIDITDRKVSEQLLNESEQRYISIFEHNPDAIGCVDLKGNVWCVNKACENLFGYSSEELTKMSFSDLISPQDFNRTFAHFVKTIEGVPQNYETTLIHKDGHPIEVLISNVPLYLNGEIIGVYGMVKDISEIKKSQEIIRQSEKLSLAGQLAAGIAHEIRNPLTSLRGFVQLFQTEDTTDTRKFYYDVMLSEIDRINEIVSELLVLARPSRETFETRNILEELDHVVRLLEAEANLRNAVIKKEFDSHLPLFYCQSSLKQMFINILKNGIESMPNGGEVIIQTERMDNQICIRFIDQGCGISQEQLKMIGQPFFTTKEAGTGLGLMICYRIIQNHNGFLRIESEEGKGTTVEITLPLIEI